MPCYARPPSEFLHFTQDWLRVNCTDFVAKDEWPPNSPDLNPLDYHVWGAMLQAFHKLHPKPKTIPELKVHCSGSGMTCRRQRLTKLSDLLYQYRASVCWRAINIVAGSNSSQGGALWGVFLLGQSPPLPYGSRRLWCRSPRSKLADKFLHGALVPNAHYTNTYTRTRNFIFLARLVSKIWRGPKMKTGSADLWVISGQISTFYHSTYTFPPKKFQLSGSISFKDLEWSQNKMWCCYIADRFSHGALLPDKHLPG